MDTYMPFGKKLQTQFARKVEAKLVSHLSVSDCEEAEKE